MRMSLVQGEELGQPAPAAEGAEWWARRRTEDGWPPGAATYSAGASSLLAHHHWLCTEAALTFGLKGAEQHAPQRPEDGRSPGAVRCPPGVLNNCLLVQQLQQAVHASI